MRKRTDRHTGNKRNILAIAFILLCIVLSITLFAAKGTKEVEARDYAPGTEKMYTTVVVEYGDTLWSLADEYMTAEYDSRDEFIEEVRQMNQIAGNFIKAGETLFIPYYDAVQVAAAE